jgi:hypothetical protein
MGYEKVIVNKSPTHLITWKFFVVFIRPRNGTISTDRWIQRTYLTPVFMVNFNLILLRSLASFKLSRPLTFCHHFSSFMRTTNLAHLIVIYFMLLKVFSEAYKLRSCTLYSFIQPVNYSCPLCLNMLLCKLFSHIINSSYYPRVIIPRCKSIQKIVNYNILYSKSFWLHIKRLEDQNSPWFLKLQITV